MEGETDTHYDAILPDLDMVPNGRRFHNGIRTNVYMVADLHRIIVEVSPICLVRRPMQSMSTTAPSLKSGGNSPHNTPFTNETIPPQGDHDRMSRSCPS